MSSTHRQAEMTARREKWARIISEAEASGLSLRAFCKQQGIDENQLYHWRRVLQSEARHSCSDPPENAFLLVEAPGAGSAELELVLDHGWRLRIPRGVDEALLATTLRLLAAR